MITRYLLEKDKTLKIHLESEWGNAGAENYSAFNSGGVECEVGEFLYGLVRMIKPKRILETGTHYGIGAAYMSQALKDNGFGKLTTIEYIPENYQIAVMRMNVLELENVDLLMMDAGKFTPAMKFDLIFLDTEPQTRFAELVRFYDNLNEGGYVFIHDLHRHMSQVQVSQLGFGWPFGPLPDEIKQLVHDDRLRPFHFNTPRGFTGFYKVSKEDYKW